MPSLTAKDRISLCLFTFDDGRRCRTPRISTSPNFCFYHAQKEAQVRAAENLATDLDYFFSGDYLSANDLNTALSRVFVAVARGDLKPRAARTLACLAQTMLQTLHLAQNEFITACGEPDWRQTVVKSINANHDYRFPPSPAIAAAPHNEDESTAEPATNDPDESQPAPAPAPAPPPPNCHPERSEGPQQDPPSPSTAETRPTLTAKAISSPVEARHEPPQAPSQPCPPERSEGPRQDPPSPTTAETRPTPQPTPPSRRQIQTPDHYAVHYGPEYRLFVDGKPFSK